MSEQPSGNTSPEVTGIAHLSITATDAAVSAQWYARVLGFTEVPATLDHLHDEASGYARIVRNGNGVLIGIHHHNEQGASFSVTNAGLDHLALGVRAQDLDAWAAWLDGQGADHSGVQRSEKPWPVQYIVVKDPDGIPVELFATS